MRADVEEALKSIHPSDAKLLSKRHFQPGFHAVPASERVLAALPVVHQQEPGPLIATERRLLFVGRYGARLSIDLSDVHGTRFTTSGVLRPTPYQLYVQGSSGETVFGFGGARESSVVRFVDVIESASAAGGQPRPAGSQASQLHSGDVLADQADERVGNELAGASAAEIRTIVQWMEKRMVDGDYAGVYGKRLALGNGPAPNGVTAEEWFWLNAFPVIAADRAGILSLFQDPFAARCARQARSVVDVREDNQRKMLNMIDQAVPE